MAPNRGKGLKEREEAIWREVESEEMMSVF